TISSRGLTRRRLAEGDALAGAGSPILKGDKMRSVIPARKTWATRPTRPIARRQDRDPWTIAIVPALIILLVLGAGTVARAGMPAQNGGTPVQPSAGAPQPALTDP